MAMSVFMILIILATTIFVGTLRTQRVLTAVSTGNGSASQTLEQITREARTGYNFANSTTDTLIFTSPQEYNVNGTLQSNVTVGYKLISGNKIGRCIASGCDAGTYVAITPPNVVIEKLSFLYPGALRSRAHLRECNIDYRRNA